MPLPAPPARIAATGAQGPTLWTSGNFQYGVYTTTTGSVMACKRTRGTATWQTFDLANIPGNPLSLPLDNFGLFGEEHESPSLGVDSTGCLWVAANNWRGLTNGVHMVKSAPHSITSWVDAANMVPGPAFLQYFSYPKFAVHPDGTMVLVRGDRRGGAGDDDPGYSRVYRVNPGESALTYVSTPMQGADFTQDSAYRNQPFFDGTGRLHMFFTWDMATGPEFRPEITHLDFSYIYSDDKGATWRNVQGEPLTIPFSRTSASGVACRVTTGFGDPTVDNLAALGAAVDGNGRPAGIFVKRTSPNMGAHTFRWNGAAWVDDPRPGLLNGAFAGGTYTNLVEWKGQLWSLGVHSQWVAGVQNRLVMQSLDNPAGKFYLGPRTAGRWYLFAAYPDPVMLHRGVVEVLAPQGNTPHVWSIGDGVKVT